MEPDSKTVAAPPANTKLAPQAAVGSALLSALLPGLGQLTQRRRGAALAHVLTVATYTAAVWIAGNPHAAVFAIAWNAWSAIDAYRHQRD